MQSPADQLRAKLEAAAKLEAEALEFYKSLPAGSLDSEDDIDLAVALVWARWPHICETGWYREFCQLEDETMAEPQWSDD